MAFARTIGSNTTIYVFDNRLKYSDPVFLLALHVNHWYITPYILVYSYQNPKHGNAFPSLLYYRGDNNKGAYYSLEIINQNNFNPSIDNNISQCCFLINQSNDFNLLLIRTINSDTSIWLLNWIILRNKCVATLVRELFISWWL